MKQIMLSLALLALAGCSDDSEDACEAERAFLAAHRACNTNADCVIVGACSGGFGFSAVQVSARARAQELSDNTSCGRAYDGPLYSASCVEGQCTEVRTGGYCGGMLADTGTSLDATMTVDALVDATSDAKADATSTADATTGSPATP